MKRKEQMSAPTLISTDKVNITIDLEGYKYCGHDLRTGLIP